MLGMTLILATEDEQKNPRLADKLIREYEVDVVEMTPSRLQTILFVDPELLCMEKTKKIMLGGEALPLSILYTLQKYTTAKIYNMYGPTESTVWASMADLTNKTKVTLGKALKNIHIFLLDDQNCIIRSQDKIGEIAISGCSLAKGYYNNSYLTALQLRL